MKDNKKRIKDILVLFVLTALISTIVYAGTGTSGVPILDSLTCLICRVFFLIFWIAGAIAALVILVAGIKWIGSGDDPSARGQAKSSVVHAIIGLVIVLIAIFLVQWLIAGISGAATAPLDSFISGCGAVCA